jgi:hypothetical protein
MTAGKRIRRALAEVPGARRIKHQLFGPGRDQPFEVPAGRPRDRGPPPSIDYDALVAAYRDSPVSAEPDTFVLYRIVGNDLPPRHSAGQSRKNLAFILEHEPDLSGCEKRFVVNRIADPLEEGGVLQLLKEAGASYIRIPFRRENYRRATWDIEGVPVEYAPWTQRFAQLNASEQGHVLMRLYRHKNNYAMNNNGARNAALRDGRNVAKWVLPWDGNCFVTAAAWNDIVAGVLAAPELPCFIVPMARITNNARLLESGVTPDADEEPQILFRRDTTIEFSTEYCYGRRPKVEMLWRLGVPGSWDLWPLEPWDPPCPPYAPEAGAYGRAGWVARLSSGKAHLEEDVVSHGLENALSAAFVDRGFARVEAVTGLLDTLDDELPGASLDARNPVYLRLRAGVPAADVVMQRLRDAADEALSRGPYSVVDKRTLPPGGNRHDYWHPAPFYWPHPLRLPGLPYVRRDGHRVPGTLLYEPLSDNYDRTRLQRLFDDTFVLTLAWRFHRERRYAEHAAVLVRTWFLEPDTAMNPHLEYAQVRRGHNGNKGNSSGIIEMKDLYYFLDAVRLLLCGGWLSNTERADLEVWFDRYLHWLQTSPQGRRERAETNNHGTYYDLQVTAIAAFLGERRCVRETLRDSRSRILQQFDTTGLQPQEMTRPNTAHYCCFNLQGWIHLAQLAEACGEDLWSFEGTDGRSLRRAIEWLLPHIGRPWPYPQAEPFDTERFYPIYHTHAARYGRLRTGLRAIPSANEIKPLFFAHDGIMPFWQFGIPSDAENSGH